MKDAVFGQVPTLKSILLLSLTTQMHCSIARDSHHIFAVCNFVTIASRKGLRLTSSFLTLPLAPLFALLLMTDNNVIPDNDSNDVDPYNHWHLNNETHCGAQATEPPCAMSSSTVVIVLWVGVVLLAAIITVTAFCASCHQEKQRKQNNRCNAGPVSRSRADMFFQTNRMLVTSVGSLFMNSSSKNNNDTDCWDAGGKKDEENSMGVDNESETSEMSETDPDMPEVHR